MLFDVIDRSRVPTEYEVEHVKWHFAEASLQRTTSDVFVIFDCCYAGDAGRAGGFSTRAFEFLAATSAGSTTRCPGPKSFTSGLIWALMELSQEQRRFTTSELTNKIKQCPEFPQDQVPVLSERNAACIERIILAPLSEDGTSAEDPQLQSPIVPDTRELLILKFVLDRYPEKDDVVKLAQGFTHMVKTHGLLFRRVIWGGIHSDSPWSLYSPLVQQAIQKFQAAGKARRRSFLGSNDVSFSTCTTPTEQTLFVPRIIHGSGDATTRIRGESRTTFKVCAQASLFQARMAFMCLWARLPRGLVETLFADQWLATIFLGCAVFNACPWWHFLSVIKLLVNACR